LPRGKMVALDVSRNMIDAARAYLIPDFGDRVEFVTCDLLDMAFHEQFDGILSTASFHWVKDHEALFAGLYRALRPGGWLCAQSGGDGNLDRFLTRVKKLMSTSSYTRYFQDFTSPWEFADPATTATRLKKAGFESIDTGSEEKPTAFENPAEFQQFVASVILQRHLERLPTEGLRQAFLGTLTAECAQATPPLLLDYIRLNLEAQKPL
jgi:trans-aconitate 2-methyltransferase